MPEIFRKLFETNIAGVPIGRGIALDVGVSSAATVMALIKKFFPMVPSELLGVVVAFLAKQGMIENFIGSELANLIATGGVYATSRALIGLEPKMQAFVLGNLSGLGALSPAATAIQPMEHMAPALPAMSALERQLIAIRA